MDEHVVQNINHLTSPNDNAAEYAPLSLTTPTSHMHPLYSEAYEEPVVTTATTLYHQTHSIPPPINQIGNLQSSLTAQAECCIAEPASVGMQGMSIQMLQHRLSTEGDPTSSQLEIGFSVSSGMSYDHAASSQVPNNGDDDRSLAVLAASASEATADVVPGVSPESAVPEAQMASAYRIGRYTPAERKIRLERYREKRAQRNFNRRVKYDCRKMIADKRRRVQGRFIKREEEIALALHQTF